jgi:hypothetical protein
MTHPDEFSPRAYRFPAGLPAEVREGDRRFPCVAENLSRTGALIVGPLPPPSDGRIDLTLKTRTGNFEARFSSHVIRIEPDPDQDGLRIAVEFVDLGESEHAALEILIARFLEGYATSPLPELRPGITPLEVRKALDAIPLAHRIGLAIRANAKEREVLRYDQNVPVVEALIRNPNLLVTEARAIAALSHLLPGTVDILAADQRFAKDDEVRIALASHPHAALQTAERLAGDLKPPQIRVLLTKATLHPVLRKKLKKKLVRG